MLPPPNRTPLPRDEIQTRYRSLQERLAPQWKYLEGLGEAEYTTVVVPSISADAPFPPTVLQAYEERFLFLLLLLRQPRARVVYLTSMPIRPEIIDYYLALLPGVIPSHARRRLVTVSVGDGSGRPLCEKILERPRLVERIRAAAGDPSTAHLAPFLTTELEQELAVRLGLPMYGADPAHAHHGTKSGGRKLFRAVGAAHPRGAEELRSADDLIAAVRRLRADDPALAEAIVKLEEGFSGQGNARIDLRDLPAPGDPGEPAALQQRLDTLRCELESLSPAEYLARLQTTGGVVEERLRGDDFTSPSVQLRISPLGEVQLLSTHDQLLGGPSGQSFLGCRFPADPGYAPQIAAEARKVGAHLADLGVIGRFAVDFVCVRSGGRPWSVHAIELNLRKGGTTHPYLTLEFLTGGRYEAETATFRAPSGQAKHYVASDHFESPSFRALTHDDLFDFAIRRRLHFDAASQTGLVYHMLSSVTEQGRVGVTAVGDSAAQADEIYERAVTELEAEAQAALAAQPLPEL